MWGGKTLPQSLTSSLWMELVRWMNRGVETAFKSMSALTLNCSYGFQYACFCYCPGPTGGGKVQEICVSHISTLLHQGSCVLHLGRGLLPEWTNGGQFQRCWNQEAGILPHHQLSSHSLSSVPCFYLLNPSPHSLSSSTTWIISPVVAISVCHQLYLSWPSHSISSSQHSVALTLEMREWRRCDFHTYHFVPWPWRVGSPL
jgi:hypothetical protein